MRGSPAWSVTCFAAAVGAAGDTKDLALSTLEASADAIVNAGLASADDVATALADLAAFAADPQTVCGSPRTFQLWARRPLA
jgi:hypothetical protein